MSLPDDSGTSPVAADGGTATAGARPRWQVLVALVCLAWYGLAAFPGTYRALGPQGIDASWRWAVNAAAGEGLVFGRDLVFTYGPLGYLLEPLDVGSNLLVGNLFAIALHLLLVAGMALWLRRASSPLAAASAALVLAAAPVFGLVGEGLWLLTVAWVGWVAVETSHRVLLDVAASAAALLVLVKLSLGVAAVAAVVLAVLGGRVLLGRAVGWHAPAVAAAVFLAAAGVCFGSPRVTLEWLERSAQIVSGYGAALSIIGRGRDVALGLVAVGVWAAAGLAAGGRSALSRWSLLLAPLVLLQFRLGYVRQDGHEVQLFGFLFAAGALALAIAPRPRRRLAVAAALLTVAVCVTVVAGRSPADELRAAARQLSGVPGAARLSALLQLPETRRRLAAESAEQLADLELPPSWRAIMGSRPGPVGTLPWECLYAPANGLRWDPAPTLQLYAAYTAYLDRWSARHYAEDGPRFILDEYQGLGKRHQMWDAPATWRTIFRNYRVVAATEDPLMALLERRPQPLAVEYVEVARGLLPLDAPVAVPASPNLLFAELDLRPTWSGRLEGSLFRVPLVVIELYHASGRVSRYRMIPDTARNGILINFFPGQVMERYLRLWGHPVPDPVVRMTVTGPGSRFFRSPAAVVWKELRPLPRPPS